MHKEFFYLPDIGRNSNILLVLLFGQVLATAYWLITGDSISVDRLGLISSYIMIANLLICLLLSLIRPYLIGFRRLYGAVLFSFIVVSVYVCVELGTQLLLREGSSLDASRFFALASAAFLVSLIIIRFTAILHIVNMRTQAESESRVLALQARIQPHFLFNCLNTISELIIVAPKEAEEAVESLSLLFRASLEDNRSEHTLANELELCDRYLELERWRFEKNLKVTKNVLVAYPDSVFVPKLILQPLVENAIKYGVQQDGTIRLKIDIRETSKDLSFLLENPVSKQSGQEHGHGIALENIKERLQLLYDDQHVIKVKQSKETFSVLMRLPKKSNT